MKKTKVGKVYHYIYNESDKDDWYKILPSLRPAGLYEIMGPNYKNIYFNPRQRPYVKK